MRHTRWNSRFTLLATAGTVVGLLGGCGGGSSGSTTGSSVQLSGHAATGMALASATVDIKCATGTGTATTSSSGAYTASLANATLPCVLKVTSIDGSTTLHSVAVGSGGGTVVANLTPLTELVLAQAAGQTPDAFFNTFSSAQSATISASTVALALTQVATALNSSVSIGTLNPFTAALVPATSSSPAAGNAYDQLLDQLATSVANAQTSLTQVVQQITQGNTSSIGSALQSTLASDFAAGIFSLNYDFDTQANQGQWGAEVHLSTSGPVNGLYPFTGARYTFASGAWGPFNPSDANQVLTASGWMADTANLTATVQQTGLTSFLYTSATQSAQMTMVSSSPATFALANLPGASGLPGTVSLPPGAKVFSFTQTNVAEKYQLNGGTGFSNITTLANFRTQHSSNAAQWNGGHLSGDALLQWRFGPGTTGGALYLATNYFSQNPPALADGTWEIQSVHGVDIMVLNIPDTVNANSSSSSGLAAGQKFLYAVLPSGNVQEGRYFPAGTQSAAFTNFNRIAANALISAIGGMTNLPN
jgi:hypothetical protein